jgi:hypothetical protein
MHDVYLHLDDSAKMIGKVGAEFVFAADNFRSAAELFSPEDIAELYLVLREACFAVSIPEDHWRAEFERIFCRGREVIPPRDWKMYEVFAAPELYWVISEGTPEQLQSRISRFRLHGFQINDVRLSLKTLAEALGGSWTEANAWPDEVFSPLQFAEWRGRAAMAELLRQAMSERTAELA